MRQGLWLVAKESLVPIRVSPPACERPKDSTTKQPAALRNFSRLWRRIYVGDGPSRRNELGPRPSGHPPGPEISSVRHFRCIVPGSVAPFRSILGCRNIVFWRRSKKLTTMHDLLKEVPT